MCKIGSPLLSFLSCSLCTLLQYKIYKDILGGELSDYKIAKKYNITRQYVHRLRKQLYLELRERYFDIKK